jgi:class 3 adenylate cyclase/HAMP domain-containing protein
LPDITITEWIGTAVAAGGALAAATAYITNAVSKVKLYRQTAQLEDLRTKYAALEKRYQTALEAGQELTQVKLAIENEFSTMADRVGATAGAIFLPVPTLVHQVRPTHLVFFSTLGDAGGALRRQRVPIESSDAGKVFTSRQPMLSDSRSGETGRTDKASNFGTLGKISVPLFRGEICVGVVQFLNKQEGRFSPEDIDTIVRHREQLGAKIGALTRDPENLRKFGITPSEPSQDATILFGDLSNSSRLARQLDAGQIVDMFNEYFEQLCDVALELGGTIDQFIGDGFMVTFNARRPVENHEKRALQAAVRMQARFASLKARWEALSYRETQSVFSRIGLNAGPVRKAEMGHSQFKHNTVMGPVVNDAHRLCQLGDRSKNVIILGEAIYSKQGNLPGRLIDVAGDTKAFELDYLSLPGDWSER